MNIFITNLTRNPQLFFAVTISVIISLTIHEFMHALAALRAGDRTAADQGRLTLNPLRHISLTALITLLAAGIAWGSTPVDPSRFRNRRRDEVLVAAAGPLSNLLLGVLTALLTYAFYKLSCAEIIVTFCFVAAQVNIFLAIFNLLPLPGLDGFVILSAFLPPDLVKRMNSVTRTASIAIVFMAIIFAASISDFSNALVGIILKFAQAVFQ
jgi:Zn-dependent protease